jgi:hypothetical protein
LHRDLSVGGHGQYTGAFPVVKVIGSIPRVHDCGGDTRKMNRLVRRSGNVSKRCHLGRRMVQERRLDDEVPQSGREAWLVSH